MATPSNPEISAAELEIKRRGRRRLIGAITIGLLAIVFLPMVFDSEPRRSGQAMKTQDISVQVPAKEDQPALPAPSAAPVVVPAAPVTATAAPVADAPKTVVATELSTVAAVPAAPPAKDVAKEAVKTAMKSEKPAKAVAPPQVEKSGFVVQLGVFSDADNAKQVIDRMKEAKLVVYTESIPIKSGAATRVRVGPYATREKADAALAQVKLTGADGKIVPLQVPGR